MTLIEIMLVMTLITFLTVAFATRLFSPNTTGVKSFLRHIKVLSRELHIRAQLEKVTYRIVLSWGYTPKDLQELRAAPKDKKNKILDDIRKRENGRSPHNYWVEKASSNSLTFQPDSKILKKAKVLSNIVQFKEAFPKMDSSEKDIYPYAYLYYYPEGFSDAKLVHIEINEESIWSFALMPLSGELELFNEEISFKEAIEQKEK